MEIDQSVGLNETEYLKRPEIELAKHTIGLPKSTPEVKIKKKRVVSQKQLDSLKKAREASVAKRKIIKEQKIRDKEMAREAKVMAKKQQKESPPKIMETVEEELAEQQGEDDSRASTPEELIDMDSVGGFNYDRVVSSVYDMIQAEKATRKPAKEAKWNKRFSDEEHIRIDERNKLLDLVKQMEEGEKKAKKKKAVKAPFDANHYLSNNRPSRDINWDNCFSPRRGGNNFF